MKFNRRTVLGAGAVLAGATTLQQGYANAATRKSGASKSQRRALKQLEDYVERHRAEWGLPGMAVCVVGPDGLEGHIMSGLADVAGNEKVRPETIFQIGSISKMLAGLTIWSQIDEGKLSIDSKLADLMPEINVDGGEAITIKHLLDHTSGLPRDVSPFYEGGLWVNSEPGAKWAYSNTGYKLAGLIAGRLDNSNYPETVERRVLKALGMTASYGAIRSSERMHYAKGYEPARMDRPSFLPCPMVEAPWVDYDGASGCVAATSDDMAKFLRFLLDISRGKGAPLFSDSAAEGFLANPAEAPGWGKGVQYGAGVARVNDKDRDYLHHTGGMVSFTSSLHVDPEAGVAAFASANAHYATTHRPRNITLQACDLVRAASNDDPAPEVRPFGRTNERLERFVGTYTAQDGSTLEANAQDGALTLTHNGDASVMKPLGDLLFVSDNGVFADTGVQFELEDDKAVRAWAGEVEFLADPARSYVHIPDELKALAGVYVNNDRWATPLLIFARDGALFVGAANYTGKLVPAEEGAWRDANDETTRDRARFDHYANGRPQRFVGADDIYYRWNG